MIAFGADLSLTHGSVVRVQMIGGEVTVAEVVYKWVAKDKHRLSLKSTPSEIHRKVQDIAVAIYGGGSMIKISIDWSSVLIFWKVKRLFAVQMGMFLGMLYRMAIEMGISLFFVTPLQVRKYWELPQKTSKLEIQDRWLQDYPLPALFKQHADEDDIDAYILAIYTLIIGEVI